MNVCVLLVSKGIVDAHQGSLSVFSEGEGHGSTFTLQLNIDTESGGKRNSVSLLDSVELSSARSSIPRRWSVGSIFTRRKSYTHDNQKVQVLPSTLDNIAYPNPDRGDVSPRDFPLIERKDRDACDNDNDKDDVCEWKEEDAHPPTPRAQLEYQMNSSYSVLIVDDSVPTRSMLSKVLKPRCRKVDQAGDGVEALRMVQLSKEAGDPYDVIFMDSEMTNMNGPMASREIREQLGYQGMIIGVTGNALPEDIANFKDHGADDVLVKPLKINQFEDILNRVRRYSVDV